MVVAVGTREGHERSRRIPRNQHRLRVLYREHQRVRGEGAAYGAYMGIPTTIIVPKGNISRGKMAQAIAYGARIMLIQGNFDHALELVRELTSRHPIALVNSVNPNRIQGQKTAAFEIIEDLETAPDFVFIPVGNAGNITAYWQGFQEAFGAEWTSVRPRMMGFQAQGAAP